MLRVFHIYLPVRTVVLAISECLLIAAAVIAANYLWFGQDAELRLRYEHGLLKAGLVVVVCMLCMYYYDLYDSAAFRSLRDTQTKLIQVLGTTCVILAVLYYAFPDLRLRRSLFVLGIILAALGLAVARQIAVSVVRFPGLQQRMILLGGGVLAQALAREVDARPELGLRVLGCVADDVESSSAPGGLKALGGVSSVVSVVETYGVQRIVLADGSTRADVPVKDLLRLKARGVSIEDAADLYEAITGKLALDSLTASSLLASGTFRISRGLLAFKRAGSIAGSALGLVLALPLMAVIAAAIRLDSPGPVLFRQRRVGRGGKQFTLYKFRSMRDGADADGEPKAAAENDPRITRVGRWLRRMRLDELPQLYNILRGDMTFVGPRPFTPNMEAELAEAIPFYTLRWIAEPGATGWAQVQNGYCSTLEDNREKLAYDLFYIKNLSIGLDFLILFQTAKILLLGRGAR